MFYTPEQVAGMLQVTRRTVYNWLTQGKLRGGRFGDLWRITPQHLEAFIAEAYGGDAPQQPVAPAPQRPAAPAEQPRVSVPSGFRLSTGASVPPKKGRRR